MAPTVAESASTGDRLATLRAIRDVLAEALSNPEMPTRELAAVSRQLTLVLAEIAELSPPVEVKGNPLDELKNRRAARGSTPVRAAGSGSR